MAQLQGGAGSDWWRRYQLPQQASTSRGPITVLSFEAGVAPGPFEAAAEVAAVALAEARENAARSAAAADAVAALYSRPPVPYYMLRDGTRMPAVGLGTWKAAPGDVRHAVNTALQAGYGRRCQYRRPFLCARRCRSAAHSTGFMCCGMLQVPAHRLRSGVCE